jgi:vancomycin resistance protein VanJ
MLKRIGIGLLGIYIIGIVALALLRVLTGDAFWWATLLYNFVPYYFLPVLVLLPLALAARWRPVIGWMLVLGIIGLIWCGSMFIPRTQPPAVGRPFSLVSFNIFPGNTQLADAEAWLLDRDADVILLQEVDGAKTLDAMPALTKAYPHQVIQPFTNGHTALSRYPIINSQEFTLLDSSHQQITLDVDGQALVVYNVHLYMPIGDTPHVALPVLPEFVLSYDEAHRNTQISQLLDVVRPALLSDTPFIVAGDFNLSEFSPIYATLAAALGDSYRATNMGMGATFPGGASEELPDVLPPLLRLDYAWHGAGLRPVYSEIGPRLGSDHLPLFVIFEFAK